MKHQIIRKHHSIFLILFINIISYIELLLCRFFYDFVVGQNVYCSFGFCYKVWTERTKTKTKRILFLFLSEGSDEVFGYFNKTKLKNVLLARFGRENKNIWESVTKHFCVLFCYKVWTALSCINLNEDDKK